MSLVNKMVSLILDTWCGWGIGLGLEKHVTVTNICTIWTNFGYLKRDSVLMYPIKLKSSPHNGTSNP